MPLGKTKTLLNALSKLQCTMNNMSLRVYLDPTDQCHRTEAMKHTGARYCAVYTRGYTEFSVNDRQTVT